MNSIDNFFKAIEAYQSFNEQEKDFLTEELAINEFDKGDFFVKEREHSNELAFILRGYMRKFYFTENGEEITAEFNRPVSFVRRYRQSPDCNVNSGL